MRTSRTSRTSTTPETSEERNSSRTGLRRLTPRSALGIVLLPLLLLVTLSCDSAGDSAGSGETTQQYTQPAPDADVYQDPELLAADTVKAAHTEDLVFFQDHTATSLNTYYDGYLWDLMVDLEAEMEQHNMPVGEFTEDLVEGPEENLNAPISSFYTVYGEDPNGDVVSYEVAVKEEEGALKFCSLSKSGDPGGDYILGSGGTC